MSDVLSRKRTCFTDILEAEEEPYIPPEVKSGDILLFRTNTRSAKLVRSVTGGHYDHAALVLETKSGLHCVECISEGVRAFNVQDRLADCRIESVAIRHVRGNIKNKDLVRFNKFLLESRDKPYSRQFKEWTNVLCCAAPLVKRVAREKEADDGFTCTSFVVKSLVMMGVIPPQVFAERVFPAHLESSNSFLRDVTNVKFSFSPERVLKSSYRYIHLEKALSVSSAATVCNNDSNLSLDSHGACYSGFSE